MFISLNGLCALVSFFSLVSRVIRRENANPLQRRWAARGQQAEMYHIWEPSLGPLPEQSHL